MTKPVKYGVIVGLLTITWVLSIYFSHSQFSRLGLFSRLICFAFLIPAIFMAMKKKRDQELGGFISLKECMKVGLIVSLIDALIVMVFTYIYYGWIDGEIVKFYQEVAEMQLKSEGKTPGEIAMARDAWAEYFTPFKQATNILMFTLLMGGIFSFICSTFVVRHPEEESN